MTRLLCKNKVTYAEAVQRVARESGNGSSGEREVLGSQVPMSNLPSVSSSDKLIFSKESFLSFVSDVLVGTKKAANRSDVIRLVVGAAERYLSIKQLPEKLHQYMMESQCINRSQMLKASSMEDVCEVDDEDPH